MKICMLLCELLVSWIRSIQGNILTGTQISDGKYKRENE